MEFTGELPFADVIIHSVIQAPDGRRMSKSLGTGIDPLEQIDAHGADALRFGLLAMSCVPGRALLRGEDQAGPGPGQQALERLAADPAARRRRGRRRRAPETIEDRWILSRLERATERGSRRCSSHTTSPTPCSSSTRPSGARSATGTSSWSSRGSTTRPATGRRSRPRCCTSLERILDAAASGHAVRDRGDLVVPARARR